MARRPTWPRLAAVLAVIVTTSAAAAVVHAALLRVDPAPDAIVARPPAVVRLWFSEPIEPTPDPLVVLDPSGERVDEGAGVSADDATRLEARVRDAGPGSYTVRWRAVSEDGHVVSGAHLYSVQVVTRTDLAGEPEAPHTVSVTSARAIHLIGMTLAVGAVALTLLIGFPSTVATRILTSLGAVGAIIVLLGSALTAYAQNAAIGGKPAIGAVSSGAVWGALWAVRAVSGAGLLALFLNARGAGRLEGSRRSGAVALVGALLCATAADGHARATHPIWLSLPMELLHLTATGAWLGGGAGLFLLFRSARASNSPQGATLLELISLVPRFSALSLLSVQTLIVTGLYQTWAHVARPALLTSTFYGQTLIVKLGLFAVIAVPAALNRFVLRPKLAEASSPGAMDRGPLAERLTRLLGIEVGVGALVVIAGAMLATLPPPVDVLEAAQATRAAASEPASERPGFAERVWTRPSGRGEVTLSLDPGVVGSNEATVVTRGGDGRVIEAGGLRLRVVPPAGSAVAPTRIEMASEGPAHRATVQLEAAGDWTLEVLPDSADAISFSVSIPPR